MSKIIKIVIINLVALSTCTTSYAQYRPHTNTFPYPSELYVEIDKKADPYLQNQLSNIVNKNKVYRQLIQHKRLSIGLVDLHDPQNIRYATINGNHMMYSASLPKIAVLLAAMESVKNNTLKYDEALKADMRLMIAQSNNQATTRVIERIGLDKIATVLKSDYYKFYDVNRGGGLWVGKKYAKADIRKPDPLYGISHGATVHQVCRFYTMLAYGKLVSSVYNDEMLKYLSRPEINHKFVNSLRQINPDMIMYRKSGSWRNFHSDSVLIDGEGDRKYILVALIEDPSGSKICGDLIKIAETALGLSRNPGKIPAKNQGPVMQQSPREE